MARTRSISDESILEAARAVFLAKGYSATTAEIARQAGISEGTIFRRFPNKEVLFVRALGGIQPTWTNHALALTDAAASVENPRAELRELLREVFEFFQELVPRMVGAMASPVAFHECLKQLDEPLPVRAHRALTGLFAAWRDAGAIELRQPPMVAARIVMGTLHSHAFFELVDLNSRLGLTVDQVIAGLLDVIAPASATEEDVAA